MRLALLLAAAVILIRDPTGKWANDPLRPWFEALKNKVGDVLLCGSRWSSARRGRKRRNAKVARERRKRGQYRRTLTIPGAQLRRLAELG
jgi:hypothetical protein